MFSRRCTIFDDVFCHILLLITEKKILNILKYLRLYHPHSRIRLSLALHKSSTINKFSFKLFLLCKWIAISVILDKLHLVFETIEFYSIVLIPTEKKTNKTSRDLNDIHLYIYV